MACVGLLPLFYNIVSFCPQNLSGLHGVKVGDDKHEVISTYLLIITYMVLVFVLPNNYLIMVTQRPVPYLSYWRYIAENQGWSCVRSVKNE